MPNPIPVAPRRRCKPSYGFVNDEVQCSVHQSSQGWPCAVEVKFLYESGCLATGQNPYDPQFIDTFDFYHRVYRVFSQIEYQHGIDDEELLSTLRIIRGCFEQYLIPDQPEDGLLLLGKM